MLVDSRLPRVPKMLPLMPVAAGARTSRPGRSTSVSEIADSATPAPMEATELAARAMSDCRVPTASGPRRPRSGLHGRTRRPIIGRVTAVQSARDRSRLRRSLLPVSPLRRGGAVSLGRRPRYGAVSLGRRPRYGAVSLGRRPRYGAVSLAVAVLTVASLVACSDDGTTMKEPGTGGATPPPAADDAVFADGEGLFALRSLAFPSDGAIPAEYSRTGGNEIPDLRWRRTPTEVAELALVVTDNDADDFVHWIVTGIPPFDDQLPPLANGVEQWPNDFGEPGWTGPDPPAGDEPHNYVFTLHALGDPLDVAVGTPSDEVMLAIDERTVETTLLVGTYGS